MSTRIGQTSPLHTRDGEMGSPQNVPSCTLTHNTSPLTRSDRHSLRPLTIAPFPSSPSFLRLSAQGLDDTMSHASHASALDRVEATVASTATEAGTEPTCPYSDSGHCALTGAPTHDELEQASPSKPVVVPQGTFVHASAPARIDLAGGWTDTIPIT